MSRWQDCIFDLYGTLADIRTEERAPALWEAMARWYRERGADYTPAALQASYFDRIGALERAAALANRDIPGACPEICIDQVFQRLFQDRGIPAGPALIAASAAYFRRCSRLFLRLYDGAEALLQALRANGQRVWLLSNAQRLFTAAELRMLGLEPYFNGIYLSSDYGLKKPDPRFFQLLLQEGDIRPENAVMIGNDGACDMQSARSLGLATIYIRSDLSPQEPRPEADYVLTQMDLALVRQILTD